MKIKIILNETYIAFQEVCYKEVIGYIASSVSDFSVKCCTNVSQLQDVLKSNFIAFQPETDRYAKPVLYNTNIIRKIEIL